MAEKEIRDKLVSFLGTHQAHMTFADAVKDFPEKDINTFPPNIEYTFWHLIEHIRRTQWDILDFSRNSDYQEITWPDDYWPAKDEKASKEDWDKTVKDYQRNLDEMQHLVQDLKNDLYEKFTHGSGQNLLREALLVIDHNSYHVGELAILRQVVGNWPK